MHVIVELKRPGVRTTLPKLIEQIEKYRSGLAKILEAMGAAHEPIEIVIILGTPPAEWGNPGGKERVQAVLDSYNAHFVLYDKLLNSAYEAYRDYEKKRKFVDRLQEVIKAIDDYAPDVR